MVITAGKKRGPFGLVVMGEAESWLPALDQIVGSNWLVTYRVNGGRELIDVVRQGIADAAVIDEDASEQLDVLQVLRMIRRLNAALPVVVLTHKVERRWLEDALRLAAFSVVNKPLELEELLRQIQRMMTRLDQMLRRSE
jgi:DNA-binding NtrC family response regulator